ncbi:MAG: phospholipid carrier-dependent glycosyltransferase [Treponema sp.]|nr:phospholipid carrier-dependent glycosyltransferase [Treponema sp.]
MYTFLAVTLAAAFSLALLHIWGFRKTNLYKKNKDLFLCAAITAIFAAYVFSSLGNIRSPQSFFHGGPDDAVVADFGGTHQVWMFQYMLGPRHNQSFTLEFSFDGEYWSRPFHLHADNVFAWHYLELDRGGARFARITPATDRLYMMEMAFRGKDMELIPITVISGAGTELFDEQNLVPVRPLDFMHSTHFDEVYYPRAAWEFIHRMEVDEWTHPPLGKVIISWGIRIFGMTPFGWRFMGAVAGIALVPLVYFFALGLFRERFWAGFSAVIFSFDFMHFVQSRIATIDVFVVLFITAMFYFMHRYSRGKSLVPLLLSGIFMGLAAATKWSGLFGAAGLAVVFIIITIRNYREHRESPVPTLAWCVVFFVLIPIAIYVLSYVPHYNTGYLYHERGFFAAIFRLQAAMIEFHTGLDEYHPFASRWWEWVINTRPIVYFYGPLPGGLRQIIASFGNPAVWWGGILAGAYVFYRAVKMDFVPAFLAIGYLSLLLPWVLTARGTQFIYYYYPNVVFLVLMIAYALKEAGILSRVKPGRHALAYTFAALTVGLFLLFYPVLAGVPAP